MASYYSKLHFFHHKALSKDNRLSELQADILHTVKK